MSCQTGSFESNGCIKDVVKRIIEAQRKVADVATGNCFTSCEQSINDLLSPSTGTRPARHTTIPFMLICKDSCRPFVGSGITSRGRGGTRRDYFECVESPVFKVRGFTQGSNNCVKLELLLPVHRKGQGGDSCDGDVGGGKHHKQSACGYFGHQKIHNFRETGICITVDLNCFCGITCLDPITPVPL